MPIVSLPQRHLFAKLGKKCSNDEIEQLCFDYGLELDEITSEKEMLTREQGSKKAENCSEEPIYKIEVPANRYDLLCTEGLTRALQIFQNKIDIPVIKKLDTKDPLVMNVTSNVSNIRKYVVCAVLRDVCLDSDSYNSLIDLQEKLHQNICRKRTLVAIGAHDLDKIKGPFLYDAVDPKEFSFVPLNEKESMNGVKMMEHFATTHLKPYCPIIKDLSKYPLIKDSCGVVLSMPPIINGDHSKITLDTKNILFECTATDLSKAEVVLDILVTTFSEYCKNIFTVEPVKTVYADGTSVLYPKLEYRKDSICLDYINSIIGTHLTMEEVVKLLRKMGLQSEIVKEAKLAMANVTIPPNRHDILHPCDIAEDVAIAYGYDKIEEVLPATYCIAEIQEINRVTALLRPEIAQAGYTECLSFSFCSIDDISKNLRLDYKEVDPVEVSNPKTAEFQVVRTTLLPGILHTLSNNKSLPLPLKIFEIQDVVLKDASIDVGCRNERHIGAIYYAKNSGFEIIHGLLDRIMVLLETHDVKSIQPDNKRHKLAYKIESCDIKTFFPGRCAQIMLGTVNNGTVKDWKKVGHFGVLHPEVIKSYDLNLPCSALEMNLHPFL